MSYVEEIRRQAEAAPRAALPAVTAALWKAFGEGHVSEAEAGALTALIEARRAVGSPKRGDQNAGRSGISGPPAGAGPRTPLDRQSSPRTGVGSRPRTDASLTRRRRWAASGRLPPALAARFTLAEQAVLALVAVETARRKDCRLAVEHMAAVVGVSRSTVKNALREAVRLGLVTVEERRLTGFRNDTNVVRVVSPEWRAWLRLARRGGVLKSEETRHPPLVQGGGVKSSTGTHTQVLDPGKTRPVDPAESCRRAAGGPGRSGHRGIDVTGRPGRAMR